MKPTRPLVRRPVFWIIAVSLLLILLLVFKPKAPPVFESEIVGRSTVSEIITSTGTITAVDEISLSFEAGGTLSALTVEEGMRVSLGDVLGSLGGGLLSADVSASLAGLQAQEARLSEMLAGPTSLEAESARMRLESAREVLLTSDIQAYFSGDKADNQESLFVPPIITGNYTRGEEGEYVLRLYPSSSQSGYSFRLSGSEAGVGEVSTQKPEPLGTSGLFIQFPENFVRTGSVEWTIQIPNTRSPQFAVNKRAYDQALTDYELSLSGARSEQVSAQMAQVAQAEAQYSRALQSLGKTTLRAPFTGVVRSLFVSQGQIVSPGQPILSLFSDTDFFVLTLYIPEADIANISVGDRATVQLTAFPSDTYEAEVAFISPAAEVREGVTSFKTELHFDTSDPRFRLGMTADVDIFSMDAEDVVSVPGRAVIRADGRTFVRVVTDGGALESRTVETGLRGSNGRMERRSGLNEGDEVIIFITEDALRQMEEHS